MKTTANQTKTLSALLSYGRVMPDHEFQIEDVGIMMMLVKVARLMENPHHQDSWVDIAGYSAITAEAIAETSNILRLHEGQQNTASS